MQRIIRVLQLKFEKALLSFLKRVAVPTSLPNQSQEKLHVIVFNIACGVGGEAM